MGIVIEVRSGRDDPVDVAGSQERGEAGDAEAGGGERPGEGDPDGSVPGEHLLRQQTARRADPSGVVREESAADEVDGGSDDRARRGDRIAEGVGEPEGGLHRERHAALPGRRGLRGDLQLGGGAGGAGGRKGDRAAQPTSRYVAVMELAPAAVPIVQEVSAATPEAFVTIGVTGRTLPPPPATVNVTATPGTGLPLVSLTTTAGGTATAAPAVAVWPLPALTPISLGAPAVTVTVAEVAVVKTPLANRSVRAPTVPTIARLVNVARPAAFVFTVAVPSSVPPPVRIVAVDRVPPATGFPAPSSQLDRRLAARRRSRSGSWRKAAARWPAAPRAPAPIVIGRRGVRRQARPR